MGESSSMGKTSHTLRHSALENRSIKSFQLSIPPNPTHHHFGVWTFSERAKNGIPKYIQSAQHTSHASTPRTIGVGDGMDARSEHVPPRPAGTMPPRTYHDRATARPGRPGTPGAPDSTQTREAIKSTTPPLTFLRPTLHNFASQDELCPKNCRTPTCDTQNAPKSHLF